MVTHDLVRLDITLERDAKGVSDGTRTLAA